MRPSFRVLLTTLPLLATGCSSLFFVEAETEEICKLERALSFPGALPGTASVEKSIAFPIGNFGESLPEGDTESALRLQLFQLTATGGNPDLRGIESATVSMRKPGQSTPTKLLEYRRPANPPATQQISATGNESLDLLELARQEEVELLFEARGSLPPQDWTADFRACAGLRIQVNYFDLLF